MLAQVHDFRTEPVQRYITTEMTAKFAGVEEYQKAHPKNFGENATCSHFPTSNISTQGSHIGECYFLLIVRHR